MLVNLQLIYGVVALLVLLILAYIGARIQRHRDRIKLFEEHRLEIVGLKTMHEVECKTLQAEIAKVQQQLDLAKMRVLVLEAWQHDMLKDGKDCVRVHVAHTPLKVQFVEVPDRINMNIRTDISAEIDAGMNISMQALRLERLVAKQQISHDDLNQVLRENLASIVIDKLKDSFARTIVVGARAWK